VCNASIARVTEELRVKCPYLNPSLLPMRGGVGGGGDKTLMSVYSVVLVCVLCVSPSSHHHDVWHSDSLAACGANIYLTFCTFRGEETVA
jgi:hypothetical protein